VARLTDNLLQAKNDPPPVRQALFDRHAHCPAFACHGQFLLEPLTFGKQAKRVGPEERLGKIEQPVERRAGTRGDDIDRVRRHSLDAAGANRDVGPGDTRRLPQESAPPGIRLDEFDTRDPEDRKNKTGKSSAAAEIDQTARRSRDERAKLRRIEDVSPPQIRERIAADEVSARRPLGQQTSIGFEPRECFT